MLCIYFPLTGYIYVHYTDRFFLMLGTFFPKKLLGTSIIDRILAFFLWWKAEQYNQENRKEKKYYDYVIFFIHLTFFSFVLTCSLHPCKRVPSEHP
jgi:hypothetical protein